MFDSFLSFLDPILQPLILLNPIIGLVFVCVIIAVFQTLVTKYSTDQIVVKHVRAEIKKLQKQLSEHKSQPDKLMEIQTKMMELNGQILKQQIKPMFISMIPMLLVVGWIFTHLTHMPLELNEPVEISVHVKDVTEVMLATNASQVTIVSNTTQKVVDGVASFTIQANSYGTYPLTFRAGEATTNVTVIFDDFKYSRPDAVLKDKPFTKLQVGLKPRKILSFGSFYINGFWAYILFSIVFSLIFRKVFDVA